MSNEANHASCVAVTVRRPQGRDLWPGAVLAGFVFSISERHKSNRALITTATIDPLELPGLVAAYSSTCRARRVSVEPPRQSRTQRIWYDRDASEVRDILGNDENSRRLGRSTGYPD